MKRPLALLISAGITAFILSAVLAVAASRLNSTPAIAATVAPNVIIMTATPPPALEAQPVEQEDDEEEYAAERHDDDENGREEVEFKGLVEAMTPEMLTVSGQVLLITERSKIERGVGIGSLVEVHARVLEGGVLWAKEVGLDD